MSEQPDFQDQADGPESALTHRQTITDTPVEDAEQAQQDMSQPSPHGEACLCSRVCMAVGEAAAGAGAGHG